MTQTKELTLDELTQAQSNFLEAIASILYAMYLQPEYSVPQFFVLVGLNFNKNKFEDVKNALSGSGLAIFSDDGIAKLTPDGIEMAKLFHDAVEQEKSNKLDLLNGFKPAIVH